MPMTVVEMHIKYVPQGPRCPKSLLTRLKNKQIRSHPWKRSTKDKENNCESGGLPSKSPTDKDAPFSNREEVFLYDCDLFALLHHLQTHNLTQELGFWSVYARCTIYTVRSHFCSLSGICRDLSVQGKQPRG